MSKHGIECCGERRDTRFCSSCGRQLCEYHVPPDQTYRIADDGGRGQSFVPLTAKFAGGCLFLQCPAERLLRQRGDDGWYVSDQSRWLEVIFRAYGDVVLLHINQVQCNVSGFAMPFHHQASGPSVKYSRRRLTCVPLRQDKQFVVSRTTKPSPPWAPGDVQDLDSC